MVVVAIAAAAGLPRVRLVTLGRGSLESEPLFREALNGSSVEYSALGVLPPQDVSEVLAGSDVSLFVRGPVSTQRGSAIASIACGVPLVAYADSGIPDFLVEAGVLPIAHPDRAELAQATVRVLTDQQLRSELCERSRRSHEKYFSWEAVASRFLEVLQHA
jgi:glycosyltransferase involved in cell wall biosynthesis